MAGKRHHTIPRFLLKGFASSFRGDEVNVWMYRKGEAGIELNIINVGVEGYFYGTPKESDLDDRITAIEGNYAPLVDGLRAHSQRRIEVSDPQIPALVTHLTLRTRPLRQWAVETADSMLQTLQEHLSQEEVFHEALLRRVTREGAFRDKVRAHLISNGIALDLDLAMAHIKPRLLEVIAEQMPSFVHDFRNHVDEYISMARSKLPDAVRTGVIDSMSRNLSALQRPEAFAKYNWFVLRTDSAILLGDTVCLFATTGERHFKPLEEPNKVHRVYLPLANDCLLVGTPFKSAPRVDFQLLNKAVARCSYKFFVSSRALPNESWLIKGLGDWSGILSKREVQSLLDDLKREFFQRIEEIDV